MSLKSFFNFRSTTTSTYQRSWSGRGWWAGLALILLLAGGLRLLSYDFSLPYVDHPDEPNWYLFAQEWRDPTFESQAPYLGAPPIYIGINAAVQTVLEAVGQDGLAPTVRVLRILAVISNLATIGIVAHLGKLAGGYWAGLLAGFLWGLSPVLLREGIYALPDPLVYLCVAMALWLAAVALTDETRQHFCVWSVLAGLVAILIKYPVVSAVIPGIGAALVILRRNRRQGVRYLVIQFLLILLVGLFLILYVDFGRLQNEAATVQESGISNLFHPGAVWNNLLSAIKPVNLVAFIVIGGLGLVSFVLSRKSTHRRPRLDIVALCGFILISIPWLSTAIGDVTITGRLRDVLPATSAAAVIIGVGFEQIIDLFPQRLRYGVILLASAALFFPWLDENQQIVQQRMRPDLRVTMRQWFDVNLDPGTVIVTDQNEKTFNPLWGGIPYHHWVDWWLSNDIMEHSLTEWCDDRSMSYAVLPIHEVEAMQATDEGRAYLAGMLRLRDFTSPTPVRGPEMIVYRLWRMAHETAIRFGDRITLTGYDLSATTVSPGDQLELRLYWNASATPKDNYSVFIHLVPADDYAVLAQFDGLPAAPQRRTLTWDTPSETMISPWLPLTIPDDLSPGSYRVMVGLYNFNTGVRLPVRDANGDEQGDVYRLAAVQVTDRG